MGAGGSNYFINDGDKWLRENHWKNAVFQYKTAIELYPEGLTARVRLAGAYSLACKTDHMFCKESIALLNELIRQNPDLAELFELSSGYYISVGMTEKARNDFERAEKLKQDEK